MTCVRVLCLCHTEAVIFYSIHICSAEIRQIKPLIIVVISSVDRKYILRQLNNLSICGK